MYIKKNLSLLFKGKMWKVYQVNSYERDVSHNWTTLTTKSFLARVVLNPPSQIFFKKNWIDLKKMYYMQGKNEIDIF